MKVTKVTTCSRDFFEKLTTPNLSETMIPRQSYAQSHSDKQKCISFSVILVTQDYVRIASSPPLTESKIMLKFLQLLILLNIS